MNNINIYIDSYKELINNIQYESAVLSNTTAFINEIMDNINWVGFYLYIDNRLVLSYFQGKVACTTIDLNKGVCGHSFTLNKTVIVPNVDEFPGHIVCDSASKSEIVIPVNLKNKRFGVLDIDSPILDRFREDDKILLENIVKILEEKLNNM